jgi:hypothetical protein
MHNLGKWVKLFAGASSGPRQSSTGVSHSIINK